MTRILVTGASGFLGSRLVRHFAEAGAQVRAAHSRRSPLPIDSGAGSHVEHIAIDVTDIDDVMRAVEGQTAVMHAAAKVHGSGAATEAAYERVNVDGTRNIVRASQEHGLGRLLFVSSTAALGGSPDPLRPATEETPHNVGANSSPYADSKRRADALVLAARSDQLTTMVAYPGFIFGSHGSRYRGSEVIEGILSKRIAIITNGGLSVVHVEDVVVGLANALLNGRGGERYIMSGDNVSFAGIAETVMSMAGRRRPTLRLPNVARDLLGRALGHAARRRGDLPPLHLDPAFAYRFYSSDHARRSLGFTSRGFAEIVSDYLAFQRALQ